MELYEKLVMLEAIKRIKDEENEINEVVTDYYKEYEAAYCEYVNLYSKYARIISSARNINAICKISLELDKTISTFITEEDITKLNAILRCPYFHYMPQNTIDLMRQALISLRYDKKLLHDIFHYIKRNKYLKETIDNILLGKDNDLKKCIPNLVDMMVRSFDIE